MRRSLIWCIAAISVAGGSALAQAPPASGKPHQARTSHPNARVNRVPENANNGKPGSANSPNPAPNVPPVQTPTKPLR